MTWAFLAQVVAIVAVVAALVAIPDRPSAPGEKRRGLSRRGALVLLLLVVARSTSDEIRRGPPAERVSNALAECVVER